MDKKYELLKDDKIEYCGHTLYRIKALRQIAFIEEGTLGGYIESEENLSQEEDFSFVGGEAKVFCNSYIYGNAVICKNAIVKNIMVGGGFLACGDCVLIGNSDGTDLDYSNAVVCDSACIKFSGKSYNLGLNSIIGGEIVMIVGQEESIGLSSGVDQREKFIKSNLKGEYVND